MVYLGIGGLIFLIGVTFFVYFLIFYDKPKVHYFAIYRPDGAGEIKIVNVKFSEFKRMELPIVRLSFKPEYNWVTVKYRGTRNQITYYQAEQKIVCGIAQKAIKTMLDGNVLAVTTRKDFKILLYKFTLGILMSLAAAAAITLLLLMIRNLLKLWC